MLFSALLLAAALAGAPSSQAPIGNGGQAQTAPGVNVSPNDPQPTKSPTPVIATNDAFVTSKPAEDRVVCRTYEDTGTRLGKNRRCLKVSEWAVRDSSFKRELGTKLDQMISTGPQ